MTAGEAVARARALRPGCSVGENEMKEWLRRQDGEIRARVVEPGGAADYGEVGADKLWAEGLEDSAVLLVPFPFDAALGETDRYAGAMTRCNAILGEFAAWLRRSCPPPVRRMRW